MSKEARIGIFVIFTIAAAIIVINFLRGNDFMKGSYNFYSIYESVDGLNPGSPVNIKGFKAGSISAIEYDKKSDHYVVKLNVKKDFDIPKDTKTEIYSSDILGGKSIRLIFGVSSSLAVSGDTLIGSTQPDMLNQLLCDVAPLASQLQNLMANLDTAISNINKILDKQSRDNIADILTLLQQSAQNIEYITSNVGRSTPELVRMIANLDTLSSSLILSAGSLGVTLDNVEEITTQIKESQLKETIQSLKELADGLRNPNGSIGKMMTTDSLHNSLNNLANDIDSLVKKIEANPKKYIKISVF